MSNKITNPAEHRAILLHSIEALLEGRITVPMANAVVGLSGELHKSIKQEWDMRVFASENLNLKHGEVVKMLES